MTKKELKELMEKNQIVLKFDTIQEVEDFLNGWDFFDFLNYDWHEKDEKKESDRYYSVMIRRQQEEEDPMYDSYYVKISAYELNGIWVKYDSYYIEISAYEPNGIWVKDGEYSEVISYSDLLKIIDG